MKYLFLILLSLVFIVGFSQTSNKKKVLIVPYGRFDFVSDYTLEEIANKNNIPATEVFNQYQIAVMNAFKNYKDENFEFELITNETYNIIKKYLKRRMGKFKGKKYYASNIKVVPDSIFNKFMTNQHTDFVVFINWYSIKKSVYISLNSNKKRSPFSIHLFDFDIYNLFKQKLFGKGEFKIVCNAPSNESVNKKLLDLKSLNVGYKFLAKYIVTILNRPIASK